VHKRVIYILFLNFTTIALEAALVPGMYQFTETSIQKVSFCHCHRVRIEARGGLRLLSVMAVWWKWHLLGQLFPFFIYTLYITLLLTYWYATLYFLLHR